LHQIFKNIKKIDMRVQVVLLGPVKQPSYYRAQEWSEFEIERSRWYKICYNTDFRVGDGFKTTFDEQCAFMTQPNLEVYGAHNFESDGNYTIDRDFVELEDWVDENCCNLMEINLEDEEGKYE
jgi:hypothetical protein